ncbi:MAG TPA: TonB-dependent receptor [Allosphingosinicella sp.]|jgi:hypothetical protein
MKSRLRASVALPGLLITAVCFPTPGAAQIAQTAQTGPSADDNEIVVTAAPGDRVLIDRETYVVRDTPLAQTKPALEVIRNLPSVTVDATGQLRLLGSRNVKILIDGRDVADASAVLENLQASRIARIEVMTNPSAQFSAYGSAGIINIVLRRTFVDGLAGSAVVGAGNPGYFTAKLSPTWSGGKWSAAASPALTISDSHTAARLERIGAGENASLGRLENQRGRGTASTFTIQGQASFEPDTNERYDFTANLSRSNGRTSRSAEVSSPSGLFAPLIETQAGKSALDSEDLSIERTAKGRRDGEEFKVSLSWSRYAVATRNNYIDRLPLEAREIGFASSIDQAASGIKADYTVPVRKKSTLSIGAELQLERQDIADSAFGHTPSGPVAASDRFAGHSVDVSVYGTFQTQLGRFRVLPGLRAQNRRFGFDAASGLAPVERTLLFPSLHVELPVGKVNASLSISRRADWPSIGQFLPYRRITGPTTVDSGNAALRPERTLNIEAAARTTVEGQQVSLKLYSRRRSDVRDTALSVLESGELLSTPINIGTRLSRGGQLSLRGNLSPQLRYSASAWAATARYNRLAGTTLVRDDTAEYGGNVQVDYSDGKSGEPGFDQLILNARYQGPLRNYQFRTSAIFVLDLDYTHYLTKRLTVVASLSRLIGTKVFTTERFATFLDERSSSRLYGPMIRVSLNYRLGRK